MSSTVHVRPAQGAEIPRVADLIEAAFARSIAPDYGPAGRVAFRMYAAERAIRERLAEGALGLVACVDARIVGYAEVQGASRALAGRDHISLLFIDPAWQRRGIGRVLLEAVVGHVLRLPAPPRHLTVHAAPSALAAYHRLGFRPTGAETVRDGLRFVPMVLPLSTPAIPAAAKRVPRSAPPSAEP